MVIIKLTIKFTLFLTLTVLSAFLTTVILLIFFPLRYPIGTTLLQYYSKLSLIIFRVNIQHAEALPLKKQKDTGILLISNHASFLDIFILSSIYKTVYVSKLEVKYYPLIGQTAWLIGILFLNRRSEEARSRVIRTIAQKAKGKIVTIFAQGTTSRIEDYLPFKCGIFKTLQLNHQIYIIPVTIRYNEDADIAWTADQNLLDNVKRVCSRDRIHVKIYTDRPVSIEDYGDMTISEVCKMTEQKVLSKLKNE